MRAHSSFNLRSYHLQCLGNQKGVALVFVLLILILLSIIAGSFSRGIRSDASIVHQTKTRLQSNALRDAGLAYAQFMLSQPTADLRWKTDARSYPFTFDGHPMNIEIQDEAGKFDLNLIDQELLQILIATFEENAESLSKNIIAFREGEGGFGPDSGHLDTNLDPSTPQTKWAFKKTKELFLVDGVTESLYQQLAPLLTVYSRQKAVDLGVASEAVLNALPDSDPAWVQHVLESRNVIGGNTSISIPSSMSKYASVKTARVGQYLNISVWLTQADGVKLATSVVLHRNVRRASPVFKELERNIRHE